MSRQIPIDLHPVAAVQDRYLDVYSGGEWLAVAGTDERLEKTHRISRIIRDGPHGDDLCASDFWAHPPCWIATGATPQAAIEALLARSTA